MTQPDIDALYKNTCNCEGDNAPCMQCAEDTGWNDALDHLIAQGWGPRVPDGWKLVPVEPTEKMLLAGGKSPAGVSPRGGVDWLGAMLPKYYKAMIAAAPTPEAGDE